jgi:hypothetical protein
LLIVNDLFVFFLFFLVAEIYIFYVIFSLQRLSSVFWNLFRISDLILLESFLNIRSRSSGIFLEYQISFFWNLSWILDLVLLESFSKTRYRSLRSDNHSWLLPHLGNFSKHKVRVYFDVFLPSVDLVILIRFYKFIESFHSLMISNCSKCIFRALLKAFLLNNWYAFSMFWVLLWDNLKSFLFKVTSTYTCVT